jgi:pyruvate kinase
VDLIARSVYHTAERSHPRLVAVPTRSGNTARRIARFRLPCPVVAFTPNADTAQRLCFSYGVYVQETGTDLADWTEFVRSWLTEQAIEDGLVLLTQGPSAEHPCGNHRLEIIELDGERAEACR